MALRNLHAIRKLYGTIEIRLISNSRGISRSYLNIISNGILFRDNNVESLMIKDFRCWSYSAYSNKDRVMHQQCNEFPQDFYGGINKNNSGLLWTSGDKDILKTKVAARFKNLGNVRLVTTQAKAPPQARQMGALKVSMLSPGIVYEPYSPREKIPFWKRWFTRSGWRRTKEDIMLELKSAYAIAKLRKSGYSKKKFYGEAVNLYKEISTHLANGNRKSLRKFVTEKMDSALKNEIKQRESKWSGMYWELIEPVVKMRTLRARLIGVDRDDLSKVFVQLTLEFLTKQKFEAYDSNGAVVAGDKNKEILVREIWVFEKSMFHPGASWRLCGRINV